MDKEYLQDGVNSVLRLDLNKDNSNNNYRINSGTPNSKNKYKSYPKSNFDNQSAQQYRNQSKSHKLNSKLLNTLILKINKSNLLFDVINIIIVKIF